MATALPPSDTIGPVVSGGGVSGTSGGDDTVADGGISFPGERVVEVEGTPGDDVLLGDSRHEHMQGFRGDDVLFGGGGDDRLEGGIGDDRLEGGPGWDQYLGGPGTDTLSFHVTGAAAFVDLSSGSVIVPDAFEFVQDVENVLGSAFGDTLLGDDYDNVLMGGAGLDLLGGGLGDDLLIGGADGAYATWAGAQGAVVVDLVEGVATEWDGGTDILIDILGVVGTAHDDTVLGDAADNRLEGGAGDDRLDGRGGDDVLVGGAGDDVLIGGAGRDLVDYSGGESVQVDLVAGEARDSGGGTDTLSGIEDVTGSLGRDTLIGDDQDNRLTGSVGADILRGNGGDDVFVFTDRLDFGDVIQDFGAGDTIEIDQVAVGAQGVVNFDPDNDQLLLDPDGAGAAEAILVATVLGEAVQTSDVVLV